MNVDQETSREIENGRGMVGMMSEMNEGNGMDKHESGLDAEQMAKTTDDAFKEKDLIIEKMTQDLELSRKEAKENFDKYLRSMAEMQNQQRRFEKDKQQARQFALESFFSDMIPALDSLEKALLSGQGNNSDQSHPLFLGIELVQKQLNEIMQKVGVEPIRSVGAKFDPNIHQAIKQIPNPEAQEETVKEQYSTGYLLNGRLLRPAMVLVEVPADGESLNES